MSLLDGLPLPQLDEDNRAFWTGGEDGRLLINRCGACGFWIHPPAPVCARCFSRDVAPQAVSGRAVVATFTVNHQPWRLGQPVPYVIAIVELEEQPGLRLTTRLVASDAVQVAIGQPVEVVFDHRDDVWIPLFRPATP